MNEIEHPKKRAMLQALEKTLGVVTPAAKMVPISPVTHYNWLKNDLDYAREVTDIANTALDFAESKLFELMNNGDTASVIFYLKNKGHIRGYFEKRNLDVTTGGDKMNQFTVTVVNKPNGS
jgi:hypothetical protein